MHARDKVQRSPVSIPTAESDGEVADEGGWDRLRVRPGILLSTRSRNTRNIIDVCAPRLRLPLVVEN